MNFEITVLKKPTIIYESKLKVRRQLVESRCMRTWKKRHRCSMEPLGDPGARAFKLFLKVSQPVTWT